LIFQSINGSSNVVIILYSFVTESSPNHDQNLAIKKRGSNYFNKKEEVSTQCANLLSALLTFMQEALNREISL